ncbi:helix-turn-helix transcriptional regulator [Povalibacter sp.]|uniref:helix-turn-helix transcriptional regulator n=1 Tax=Povalibacter sp. TaxID=1962978 RepID=UPI002F3E3A70
MDKFDRIFQLHTILAARRTAIPLEDLMARLECSKPTLHRVIATMRTHLNAPIESTMHGYRYAPSSAGDVYQLPGLWFSPIELQALAVVNRLLQDMGSGLLEEHIAPLAKRLEELSRHHRLHLGEAADRLRFPAVATRTVGAAFQVAASATLQRRKLWIEYHARGSDERTERTVSPQRLTHYRESWYLDAWDESRDALRSFSIDRIGRCVVLEARALDLDAVQLDTHYASAYGIFGGQADKIAVLRFSGERARWVAEEQWHPRQQGQHLDDGSYELRIPYGDPRELVMDILRHGPEVEVMEPPALREQVLDQLNRTLQRYR